jgi:hypothetical protein
VSGLHAVNVCLQGGVCLVFSLAWLPHTAPLELHCLLDACCHVSDNNKPQLTRVLHRSPHSKVNFFNLADAILDVGKALLFCSSNHTSVNHLLYLTYDISIFIIYSCSSARYLFYACVVPLPPVYLSLSLVLWISATPSVVVSRGWCVHCCA